jgi:hypothetical protein
MKTNNRTGERPILALLATTIPVLLLITGGPAARAELAPDSYRLGLALDDFHDATGAYAAWHLAATGFLRSADHLNVELGLIHTPGKVVGVVSAGPVWRFPVGSSRFHVDLRVAPTLISADEFGDSEMGGHFHVTSSLSIGTSIGEARRFRIHLEFAHTSNADLDKPNPGLDMIGIRFTNAPN